MLIPLRVDVPTSRASFINYGLVAVIVGASILGLTDPHQFLSLAGIKTVADPWSRGIIAHLTR